MGPPITNLAQIWTSTRRAIKIEGLYIPLERRIMRTPICDLLKIEFPLVAFTHCRDVVAEVSKAGGMGVLGAAASLLGIIPAL